MLHLSVEEKKREGKWWLYRYLGLHSKYRLNEFTEREGGKDRKVEYENTKN